MSTKSMFVKTAVQSPFSSIYPRYNSWHAVQALKQMDDFLVLDVESTGIGKSAEICELAIVDYKTGSVLFDSLLCPYNLDGYESSKAREINGIGTKELVSAPPLNAVWPEILDILQSKHITSFNTDFDLKMIRNSVQKWGIDVPPFAATCLMKLCTAFLDLDYWISLEEAAEYFGIENTARHRALGDTLTTIEVVKKMKFIVNGLKG